MHSASASPRRVVITGMGVICPLGNSVSGMWESLVTGTSGVRRLPEHLAESLPTPFFAEATDFTGHIDDFGELEAGAKKAIRKGLKLMCRESQMGVASAQRALAAADWTVGATEPERTGVVFGSDYMLTEPEDVAASVARCREGEDGFNFELWGGEGMREMTPLWLLKYLPNMPACHITIYNDMRGPSNSLTLREASSNQAIGEAFRTIARGSADMMVAGATGTRVHPMKLIHAALQEQLATGGEPAEACRPFDSQRTGTVAGEGAGAIVLEELSAAQARGVKILGEVVGLGSSSVATRQGIGRRDTALANAMRAALRDAGLQPEDVDHLNTHGLGTRTCDVDEWQAIAEVFGPRATKIPVVAAKSCMGNLGAGGGVVELAGSVVSLGQGRLFPMRNYHSPDPDCPVLVATADMPAGSVFLNLSVTSQGQACCLAVKKFTD